MGRLRRSRRRFRSTPHRRYAQVNGDLGESVFPGRCADEHVDGGLLSAWQKWVDSGCDGIDEMSGESEPARSAARCVYVAATTESEGELCDLARSRWPWVRLAVAGNDHAPASAQWGDGITWFGLAGDEDLWVRAVALYAHPQPPQAVIDAITDSAQHN